MKNSMFFSPVLLGETKIENEALRITVYIYTPQMVYSNSIQLKQSTIHEILRFRCSSHAAVVLCSWYVAIYESGWRDAKSIFHLNWAPCN